MNVIQGIGVDGFSAVLYGNKSPQELAYYRNEFNNAMAVQVIGDAGKSFLNAAKENYTRFNSEQALQLARTANQHVKALFAPEVIKQLTTLEDLRTASRTMQRWIMANPEIRELHNKQSCEGFGETYIDMYPGTIGNTHYDYRRVTSGVFLEDTDGEYVVRHHYEQLKHDTDALAAADKVSILSTWSLMNMFLKNTTEDPTSPFGNSL